jgi:hypothetical protein
MIIHNIDYIVNQTSSAYIPASQSGAVDLVTTDILFAFKPLYTTEFTGDLENI